MTCIDKPVSLGPQECRALIALYRATDDGAPGMGAFFRSVAKRSRLNRQQARRAVRALARKGLAEYLGPLWDDEGLVGSGYGVTSLGRQRAKAMVK